MLIQGIPEVNTNVAIDRMARGILDVERRFISIGKTNDFGVVIVDFLDAETQKS